MSIINLCNFSPFVFIVLEWLQGVLSVLIVSWLEQGIVIEHAHLVPGFAYLESPPPES